jgi:hypothetical protein
MHRPINIKFVDPNNVSSCPQFRFIIMLFHHLITKSKTIAMLAHRRHDTKRYFKDIIYHTNLQNDFVNNAVTFLSAALSQGTTQVYPAGNL